MVVWVRQIQTRNLRLLPNQLSRVLQHPWELKLKLLQSLQLMVLVAEIKAILSAVIGLMDRAVLCTDSGTLTHPIFKPPPNNKPLVEKQ